MHPVAALGRACECQLHQRRHPRQPSLLRIPNCPARKGRLGRTLEEQRVTSGARAQGPTHGRHALLGRSRWW